MLPERWKDLIGNIKDNFQVEEYEKINEEEDGGTEIEYIIFTGPLGRMKLEYITRPVVLDKKTTYSNRIGSETKVDYVYSRDEKSHRMAAFKWDEAADDWVEIDIKNFRL